MWLFSFKISYCTIVALLLLVILEVMGDGTGAHVMRGSEVSARHCDSPTVGLITGMATEGLRGGACTQRGCAGKPVIHIMGGDGLG